MLLLLVTCQELLKMQWPGDPDQPRSGTISATRARMRSENHLRGWQTAGAGGEAMPIRSRTVGL